MDKPESEKKETYYCRIRVGPMYQTYRTTKELTEAEAEALRKQGWIVTKGKPDLFWY